MTPTSLDPEIREIDIRQALATSEKQELQIQPADQSDQRPSLPVRSRTALPSAYEAIRFGPSDWRNISLAAVAAGLGFFWTSHFFVAPEKFRPGMAREAEYLYQKPSQISDAIWNRSAETASHKAGINTNNPTATLAPDRSREASNGNNANPPSSSQTGGSATGSSQANRNAAAGARSANASTSKATAARSVASKSARRTRMKQRRVASQGARTTGAQLASHRSRASTRSSHAAPAATTGSALMEHSGLGKSTSPNMGSAYGAGLSVGGGIHGMAAHGSGGR
jgi:hypothetical protein